MSTVATPLLDTIEPDDPAADLPKQQNTRPPVVLTPSTTHNAGRLATTENDAEAGNVPSFTIVQ